MSIFNYFEERAQRKEMAKEAEMKREEDARNNHIVKKTYPIRMILPMPDVRGSVSGGGFVSNGSGGGTVSGYTGTTYQLMIFFETGNGGWKWQVFSMESLCNLLYFADEESHVVIQYQCADSDNHVMNESYERICINRNWHQMGTKIKELEAQLAALTKKVYEMQKNTP